MRIYLVMLGSGYYLNDLFCKLRLYDIGFFLITYKSTAEEWLSSSSKLLLLKSTVKSLFLDSGGFLCQMKGIQIDIEGYIDFIGEYCDIVDIYASLDPSSSKEAHNNYNKMKNMGLTPIPVYRPYEYLNAKYRMLIERYCKECDYIAIGGIATNKFGSDERLKPFLDFSFKYAHKYNTKIHGFGIVRSKILESYPFYSVDTTNWLHCVKYGQYIYFDGYSVSGITVSKKSSQMERVRGHLGLSLKDPFLSGKYADRAFIGALAYKQYEQYLTELWEKRGVIWNE